MIPGIVSWRRRSSAAYTGPLDLVPGAVVAYGVRALSAAMIGENIFRLRRSSDDAEMDFSAAADGNAPMADIVTWLAGADSFVVTWYDQSGGTQHATNVTTSAQPQLVANQINSKPALLQQGGSCELNSVGGTTIASGGYTVFAVSKGRNVLNLININEGSPEVRLSCGEDAETYTENAGSSKSCGGNYAGELSNDDFLQLDGAWQFGSRNLKCNGSDVALQFDNDSGGTALGSLSDLQTNLFFTGTGAVTECLFYDGVKSDGDRALVRTNQLTYYDLP